MNNKLKEVRINCVTICGKSSPSRRTSKCKGPEARVWAVCSKSSEEVCMDAEESEGEQAEDEVKEGSGEGEMI